MKEELEKKIQEIKDFMQQMRDYNRDVGRGDILDSRDIPEIEEKLDDLLEVIK